MLLNARKLKRVLGKERIILLAIEDITGRKEGMEKKLRNEEQRFRALTENSLDIILIMNREGIVTYINPAVEKALGFKPEERIGTNGLERIHPDDLRQATDAFITLVTDTNSPVQHGETRLRHRDGSWRTFETVGTNLVDDNIVEAVIVHHRDITERKRRSEESLQKSEENFRLSLDNPAGMHIVTAEGETLYANRAIADIYGYSSIEELKGAPLKNSIRRRVMPSSR